ncbi:tail fiber assembly protein [Edwardsiella ictaluri]|uniref:Tail fiber assembly protein n=1 Tax=Edwardsiella ictaluri TaxID=67780 RepID=A0A1S6J118_EDWIC|nr:tail fiber assembly protein [Edwardsiella ictaluri]AQS60720.1 tail fiber assembly protein [Edwardsiella ictaluri]ELV7527134.1 tail fiber assembly protein [Edwardsiella ictaluri]KMQ79332.1 hypothetical protein ABY58_03725 [Edwardsiella ictaluri]KOO55852.1 hypothetical protein ACS33_04260 [Edwardsiella ictaluri]WFN95554.1 tail fiber assembly protein [Edwardsiella ictaluri]
MNKIFDDGLATETTTVTVYGYSHENGELMSAYDVRIIAGTGIPAFSTLIEPPEQKSGKALIFNKDHWIEVTDNRGKAAYSTDTGEPVTITELGEIKPGVTLTPPSTPYDKWTGEQWVTDTAAQHAALVEDADAKKAALLNEANAITADWRTELALGIISDGDKTKLITWMNYIKAVKAVDTSTAPAITWPVTPVA